MSKYGNKKCGLIISGKSVVFDSQVERDRYLHLSRLEKIGHITDLELQPAFLLQDKFRRNGVAHRAESYVADFRYREHGKIVVEDVKGVKTALYMSKLKRFLFMNPDVRFFEVTMKQKTWYQRAY